MEVKEAMKLFFHSDKAVPIGKKLLWLKDPKNSEKIGWEYYWENYDYEKATDLDDQDDEFIQQHLHLVPVEVQKMLDKAHGLFEK